MSNNMITIELQSNGLYKICSPKNKDVLVSKEFVLQFIKTIL